MLSFILLIFFAGLFSSSTAGQIDSFIVETSNGLLPTSGGGHVRFVGSGFLQSWTVSAQAILSWNGDIFISSCVVTSDTVIDCTSAAGYGFNLSWALVIQTVVGGPAAQTIPSVPISISYDRPLVTLAQGGLSMPTSASVSVTFRGSNFGSNTSVIRLRYGAGTENLWMQPLSISSAAHSTLVFITAPGCGGDPLLVEVVVAGQSTGSIAVSGFSFSSPLVRSITAAPSAGYDATSLPWDFVSLVLVGENFGPLAVSRNYNAAAAPFRLILSDGGGCSAVLTCVKPDPSKAHELMNCFGSRMATSGNLSVLLDICGSALSPNASSLDASSAESPVVHLSHANPRLSSILGPSSLATEGGDMLTMWGESLGSIYPRNSASCCWSGASSGHCNSSFFSKSGVSMYFGTNRVVDAVDSNNIISSTLLLLSSEDCNPSLDESNSRDGGSTVLSCKTEPLSIIAAPPSSAAAAVASFVSFGEDGAPLSVFLTAANGDPSGIPSGSMLSAVGMTELTDAIAPYGRPIIEDISPLNLTSVVIRGMNLVAAAGTLLIRPCWKAPLSEEGTAWRSSSLCLADYFRSNGSVFTSYLDCTTTVSNRSHSGAFAYDQFTCPSSCSFDIVQNGVVCSAPTLLTLLWEIRGALSLSMDSPLATRVVQGTPLAGIRFSDSWIHMCAASSLQEEAFSTLLLSSNSESMVFMDLGLNSLIPSLNGDVAFLQGLFATIPLDWFRLLSGGSGAAFQAMQNFSWLTCGTSAKVLLRLTIPPGIAGENVSFQISVGGIPSVPSARKVSFSRPRVQAIEATMPLFDSPPSISNATRRTLAVSLTEVGPHLWGRTLWISIAYSSPSFVATPQGTESVPPSALDAMCSQVWRDDTAILADTWVATCSLPTALLSCGGVRNVSFFFGASTEGGSKVLCDGGGPFNYSSFLPPSIDFVEVLPRYPSNSAAVQGDALCYSADDYALILWGTGLGGFYPFPADIRRVLRLEHQSPSTPLPSPIIVSLEASDKAFEAPVPASPTAYFRRVDGAILLCLPPALAMAPLSIFFEMTCSPSFLAASTISSGEEELASGAAQVVSSGSYSLPPVQLSLTRAWNIEDSLLSGPTAASPQTIISLSIPWALLKGGYSPPVSSLKVASNKTHAGAAYAYANAYGGTGGASSDVSVPPDYCELLNLDYLGSGPGSLTLGGIVPATTAPAFLAATCSAYYASQNALAEDASPCNFFCAFQRIHDPLYVFLMINEQPQSAGAALSFATPVLAGVTVIEEGVRFAVSQMINALGVAMPTMISPYRGAVLELFLQNLVDASSISIFWGDPSLALFSLESRCLNFTPPASSTSGGVGFFQVTIPPSQDAFGWATFSLWIGSGSSLLDRRPDLQASPFLFAYNASDFAVVLSTSAQVRNVGIGDLALTFTGFPSFLLADVRLKAPRAPVVALQVGDERNTRSVCARTYMTSSGMLVAICSGGGGSNLSAEVYGISGFMNRDFISAAMDTSSNFQVTTVNAASSTADISYPAPSISWVSSSLALPDATIANSLLPRQAEEPPWGSIGRRFLVEAGLYIHFRGRFFGNPTASASKAETLCIRLIRPPALPSCSLFHSGVSQEQQQQQPTMMESGCSCLIAPSSMAPSEQHFCGSPSGALWSSAVPIASFCILPLEDGSLTAPPSPYLLAWSAEEVVLRLPAGSGMLIASIENRNQTSSAADDIVLDFGAPSLYSLGSYCSSADGRDSSVFLLVGRGFGYGALDDEQDGIARHVGFELALEHACSCPLPATPGPFDDSLVIQWGADVQLKSLKRSSSNTSCCLGGAADGCGGTGIIAGNGTHLLFRAPSSALFDSVSVKIVQGPSLGSILYVSNAVYWSAPHPLIREATPNVLVVASSIPPPSLQSFWSSPSATTLYGQGLTNAKLYTTSSLDSSFPSSPLCSPDMPFSPLLKNASSLLALQEPLPSSALLVSDSDSAFHFAMNASSARWGRLWIEFHDGTCQDLGSLLTLRCSSELLSASALAPRFPLATAQLTSRGQDACYDFSHASASCLGLLETTSDVGALASAKGCHAFDSHLGISIVPCLSPLACSPGSNELGEGYAEDADALSVVCASGYHPILLSCSACTDMGSLLSVLALASHAILLLLLMGAPVDVREVFLYLQWMAIFAFNPYLLSSISTSLGGGGASSAVTGFFQLMSLTIGNTQLLDVGCLFRSPSPGSASLYGVLLVESGLILLLSLPAFYALRKYGKLQGTLQEFLLQLCSEVVDLFFPFVAIVACYSLTVCTAGIAAPTAVADGTATLFISGALCAATSLDRASAAVCLVLFFSFPLYQRFQSLMPVLSLPQNDPRVKVVEQDGVSGTWVVQTQLARALVGRASFLAAIFVCAQSSLHPSLQCLFAFVFFSSWLVCQGSDGASDGGAIPAASDERAPAGASISSSGDKPPARLPSNRAGTQQTLWLPSDFTAAESNTSKVRFWGSLSVLFFLWLFGFLGLLQYAPTEGSSSSQLGATLALMLLMYCLPLIFFFYKVLLVGLGLCCGRHRVHLALHKLVILCPLLKGAHSTLRATLELIPVDHQAESGRRSAREEPLSMPSVILGHDLPDRRSWLVVQRWCLKIHAAYERLLLESGGIARSLEEGVGAEQASRIQQPRRSPFSSTSSSFSSQVPSAVEDNTTFSSARSAPSSSSSSSVPLRKRPPYASLIPPFARFPALGNTAVTSGATIDTMGASIATVSADTPAASIPPTNSVGSSAASSALFQGTGANFYRSSALQLQKSFRATFSDAFGGPQKPRKAKGSMATAGDPPKQERAPESQQASVVGISEVEVVLTKTPPPTSPQPSTRGGRARLLHGGERPKGDGVPPPAEDIDLLVFDAAKPK